MIPQKSCSKTRNILINKWIIVVWLVILSSTPIQSQVFPLRVSKDSLHLETKSHIPLLITATSWENSSDIEDIIRDLYRFSYQGFNTVLATIPIDDIEFNVNGSPRKKLKRHIVTLRRLVREAALKNMAVMISPYNSHESLEESTRELYLSMIFQKLNNFSNVCWLLNKEDLTLSVTKEITEKQLIGVQYNGRNVIESNIDFLLTKKMEIIDATKPVLLWVDPGLTVSDSDSASRVVRNKSYSAMLNGACGVVISQQQSSLHSLNSFHFRNFKAVFDSIPWESFQKYPQIIPDDNLLQNHVTSAITADSSMVILYLSSDNTLPLDLSLFNIGVKLHWINTVTGKVFHSRATPMPKVQLFLPPVSDEKNSEWVIILGHEQVQ